MIKQFFILFLLLFQLVSGAYAASSPQLKSQSWLLVDRLTNVTLAAKDADKRINPGNSVLLMVL